MPALYRIHEPPDPLKVLQFEEFVSAFGFSLGAPEGAVQADALPEAGRQDPRRAGRAADRVPHAAHDAEGALRLDERRALRAGGARPTRTSRRRSAAIPDLVVHRLLRELRHTKVTDERKAELDEDLPEVGRHTSERERRAAEAEREILQWKKVRFMADKVGDVFDGYITGVAAFGMFVELIDHYVEGLVHVTTMADDYYRFREQSHALFGENTKKTYRARRSRARADHPRRHGTPADRSRSRRRARESPQGRTQPRTGAQLGADRRRISARRRRSSAAAARQRTSEARTEAKEANRKRR